MLLKMLDCEIINYFRKLLYWAFEKKMDNQSSSIHHKHKISIILTQYKRKNLKRQLDAIESQTLKPNNIFVFQNSNFISIEKLRKKYDFNYIFSQYNTKYFGRFAYCLALDSDIFVVMDDDVIPGKNFLRNYISEMERLNAIVGGNGRIAQSNNNIHSLIQPLDSGYREKSLKVDFVGHVWVFRREWLNAMFSIPPYTLDTGEDMHLCFSAKLLLGIDSYVCKQITNDDSSDITNNSLANDKFSSYKKTPDKLRKAVENYFFSKGLSFIKEN